MTMPQITARHSGKSEADRLREGEQILSDRINGMPVSQMMEKYGLARDTIYRRINDATAARVAPTVDRYREMMNAAYEEQITSILQHKAAALVLIEQGTTDGDSKVLAQGMTEHARALELMNRTRDAQRKLNGLDAPVTATLNVTVTTPLDTSIASLVEALDAPASA